MQPKQPLALAMAVLALSMLLASLATRFWAEGRAVSRTGPSHITALGDRVVVFTDDRIMVLDAGGEIIRRIDPSRFGIEDIPVDLRLLAPGELMVATQQPARIRICNLETLRCHLMPLQAENAPRRQFKLLPVRDNDAGTDFWMSDARGDQLWRYATEDGSLVAAVESGLLAGPNELAYSGQAELWIADTDNRRLLELLPDDRGELLAPGRELATVNDITVDDRYYPMMLERDGHGRLWVMVASDFSLGRADLAVYDPEHGPLSRVDLPGSTFATDLVRLGDFMLVTDMDAARIYRIDTTSQEVHSFGGEEFLSAMEGLLEERNSFRLISQVSLAAVIAFAILMVLAAVKATPREQRWAPRPELFDADDIGPADVSKSGIHWLQRRKTVDRLIKLSQAMFMVAGGLLVASLFLLVFWIGMQADSGRGAPGRLVIFMILTVGAVFALVPTVIAVRGSLSRMLGCDGRNVHLRLEDGRGLVVSPEKLAYTNRALLYRQYSVPLKDGRMRSLYEEGEIKAYLAPLLIRGRKLSTWGGLLHQWRNRDKVLLWSAFSASAITALALLVAFYS